MKVVYCSLNISSMKKLQFFCQQDRNTAGRNRNQRCGNYNSVMESDYDVVNDQEEVLNVCILPARPLNEEREYAGREENTDAHFSLAHLVCLSYFTSFHDWLLNLVSFKSHLSLVFNFFSWWFNEFLLL